MCACDPDDCLGCGSGGAVPSSWPRLPHVAAIMEHVHAIEALSNDHGFDARMRDVLARLRDLVLEADGG